MVLHQCGAMEHSYQGVFQQLKHVIFHFTYIEHKRILFKEYFKSKI